MSDIIPVAFAARWEIPVRLIQSERVKRVSGPADAIRYMRDCFVDKSGPAYSRAVDICFAALRREADIDVARAFFLAAYEDELVKANSRA